MFETVPESGIANGNYNTDIKKGQQDKTHIGLVVYNTNRCAPFGHGVHVWDGIKWIGINALPPSSLTFNEKFFDLFSGADARGAIVAQSLQINWTKGDVPTWTQAASSGYAAVSFETPLGPNPLVSSPTDMTIKPSGMTINPTNPWQSKQTEVTFLSSECGLKETVIFNQTNYALQVNNVFTNSAITAKTETGTIPVKGNVTWKASSSNTAVVNSSMSTGGVTKKDGTTGSVNYPYTLDAARKYQYADITFSDTETDRRFNDLKVSILNCHPSGIKGISVNGYSALGGVLDILSKHDERGTNLAQSITVNWLPADKDLLVSSAAGALANQLTFTTPLPSSLVASSPKVMNIAAAAMPTPSAENPWVSRETKVTFTDLCGDTYDLILNQTNYALKANESYNKTLKPYRSIYNNLPIESNGTWKVTATGTTGGQTTGTGGVNLKNGTYHRAVFDYTNFISATNGGKGYKYDLTHLTFEDNVSPRRFKDITVSLINCRVDEDPTIQEWALKAGFTTTQISQVTQNAPSSIGAKNKVQLHRDQDNNLFLSGDFGTAGRWMLHNVRATKYDEVRTDGTMVISPNSIESLYTGSSLTTNYRDPHMGFPNDASTNPADPSFYNKTERIGRLYNWAAATMKKGSQSDAMGMTTFTEGETTANADHAKVQGICPRGWHLPSDKEWTVLEQEITNNTSVYSS